MEMNRRGFLGSLLGAAVIDHERLLWVPGRKTISIPMPGIVLTSKEVNAVYKLINSLMDKWYAESYDQYLKYRCSVGTGLMSEYLRPPRTAAQWIEDSHTLTLSGKRIMVSV